MYSIKLSKKTLKFGDVEVNKKEFHASKEPIALDLVDINQIVISDKFKNNGPLCIALPQMSGYIKYFDNEWK